MSALLQPSDQERILGLGKAAAAPMAMVQSFESSLSGEEAPDPQWIANEAFELIEMPHWQRPFRTVRDGLGMEEPVKAIDAAAQEAETAIYRAFQFDSMLQIANDL